MTSHTQAVATTHEPPSPTAPMRRVAAAALVGTSIEYYDFFIYGTAAALVFGPLFFPALGPAAGAVAAFATFGVAFFFRPLGAILFGHMGDRLGRKRTLIYTLTIMGFSTFAIGVMPTASTIGAAAPVALVVLRALQGIAVGGEWAGAALLTAEHAPQGSRGFYGGFPQLGPGVAMATSSATFLVADIVLTPQQFIAWGWRIPFLMSILMLAVGMYIRLKVEETPAFRRSTGRGDLVRFPFVEAIRHEWRNMLLAGGALTMTFGFFYIAAVFVTGYAGNTPGVGVLNLSRSTILSGTILGAVVHSLAILVSAKLSDRFGRRRVVLTGAMASVIIGPSVFYLMQPGNTVTFLLGMCLLLGVLAIPNGPAAAYLPEIFRTQYRYTGAGMGYNLAGILGGAIPLIVAPPLAAEFGGVAIGFFLGALGLVSTLSVLAIRETKHVELDAPVPD